MACMAFGYKERYLIVRRETRHVLYNGLRYQ